MWRTSIVLTAALVLVTAADAVAEPIPFGLYQLLNHPDGGAQPPLYGLRLDELFDVTAGHDIFTFDFNHSSSEMWLQYTSGQIEIWGTAYGGRDAGSTYAADEHLGVYSIAFTYRRNVEGVAGDDDIWVSAEDADNNGTILTPSLGSVNLVDEDGGGAYSFRFGDENGNAGHRGFSGISGWGWVNHSDAPHVYSSDWLFTATSSSGISVPEPGSLSLLGLGLIGLAGASRIRRRKG